MKIIQAKKGPTNQRPYYEIEEIERICLEELRSLDLLPNEPAPIRIDRYIEKRFRISPRYEDLEEGILGYSKFAESGLADIVISTSLDEAATIASERRVKTTLAHEAGHGLLHANLFNLNENFLFESNDFNRTQVLCRDIPATMSGNYVYEGNWWEFQANQAIAGFLLPRFLVEKALEPFLIESGLLRTKLLPADRRDLAIMEISTIFDVNPAVARIRLSGLYVQTDEAQLSL